MRVLHVTGDSLLGGTETVLLNLARHRQYCPQMQPDFLMFRDGILRGQLLDAGVNVTCLGEVRLRWPIKVAQARHAFAKILRKRTYDVVIYHQYPWMPLIVDDISRRAGCGSVRWFHNGIDKRYWPEIALRKLNPSFPGLSISCSEFLRRGIDNLGKSETVYAPVSPNNVVLSGEERRSLRREFETPEDAVVIIQVSRMRAQKGHIQHLKALGQLRDHPNWICWIVGGIESHEQQAYVEALRLLAADMEIANRVKFLGKRTDVQRLLAGADIFCQPNVPPEAFGISFIEALYAGLPVVTSAIGGALEILNESSGILVPANDITTLAETLRKLIQNQALRESFRCSGPSRAKELCAPGSQVAKLGEILMAMRSVGS